MWMVALKLGNVLSYRLKVCRSVMIKLATLSHSRMAQAFVDYMATRHIEVQIQPDENGGVSLWLVNAHYQLEAEEELKRFLHNPNAPEYHAAPWKIAETRHSSFHYESPNIFLLIKGKAGVFTLMIMCLSILVFGLGAIGFDDTLFTALHFPADVEEQWQLWRWVTHAVLHFSVSHIVFNLLWWWQFGGDIEQRLGTARLVKIFALSAVLSGAGQFWVEGANFGGLSGVVYALVGYVWVFSKQVPTIGLNISPSMMIFLLIWLVLGFVQPFMAIANTAHVIGLLSGLGLAWIDSRRVRA